MTDSLLIFLPLLKEIQSMMESILSTQFLLVNLSNKEILKVSQQVESNRLRTTLFLVGFQVATRQTMLGCSAAGSAHSSHFS